jgi:hypothetical protein
MDKNKRYLCVFDKSGWQVVDTSQNCKVMATGKWKEMLEFADALNEEEATPKAVNQ